MHRAHHLIALLAVTLAAHAQNNLLAYAGGAGNERFNDVLQLSDGRVLVDVASLHAGTYLVRWRSPAGSTAVARLVKE